VLHAEAELESNTNRDRLHAAMVAHNVVGELLVARNDIRGALPEFERAFALGRRKFAANPTGQRDAADLGRVSIALGEVYLLVGRDREGMALVSDGVHRLETLERSDPDNQTVRGALTNALDNLGTRAFTAAEGPGVSGPRRRTLLTQAIQAWTHC